MHEGVMNHGEFDVHGYGDVDEPKIITFERDIS